MHTSPPKRFGKDKSICFLVTLPPLQGLERWQRGMLEGNIQALGKASKECCWIGLQLSHLTLSFFFSQRPRGWQFRQSVPRCKEPKILASSNARLTVVMNCDTRWRYFYVRCLHLHFPPFVEKRCLSESVWHNSRGKQYKLRLTLIWMKKKHLEFKFSEALVRVKKTGSIISSQRKIKFCIICITVWGDVFLTGEEYTNWREVSL